MENRQHRVLPISVLIPTMNRANSLEQTLRGYLSQPCIPAQIVVVDQSVSKESRIVVEGIAEECGDSVAVEYLFQAEPSLTKARNQAMMQAKHEIVVCSDDDVEVNPDTLWNVHQLMRNPEIAMIAGMDENAAVARSYVGYLLGTKSFWKRNIGHVTASVLGRYPAVVRGQVKTEWAMGYFFVIRKSCARRWDIQWDERLKSYAYAEDLDFSYGYCHHADQEGLRCILDDCVRVRHLVSREYRVPSEQSTRMYLFHRAYISEKHEMGLWSKWAMAWCNFWIYIMREVRREQPQDMRTARKLLRTNRAKIYAGDFDGLY